MDFELSDSQKEIRAAVAALCARFGNEYWRPLRSAKCLSGRIRQNLERGWLALSFDSSGIRRRGPRHGRSVADPRRNQPQRRQCRRLPRANVHDGVDPQARQRLHQKQQLSAAHRVGRIAAAIFRHHRTGRRFRNAAHQNLRPPRGRSLRRQRPENLYLALSAFRHAAAAYAHHAFRSESPKRPMA